MGRFLKKLLIVLVVVAGLGAVFTVLKRRRDESMPGRTNAATWPPLTREPVPETVPANVPEAVPVSAAAADWVAPVDGQCPAGYPIKVNTTSGIYHVPDGRSYARTVAQRCYATAEAAERDGYRRAKA
jgi:hypothetical protein